MTGSDDGSAVVIAIADPSRPAYEAAREVLGVARMFGFELS